METHTDDGDPLDGVGEALGLVFGVLGGHGNDGEGQSILR
jgi:hypothetical protein